MRSILIATDGSSNAEEAVRFLSQLPHDETIEVTVLTVAEPLYPNPRRGTPDWMVERKKSEETAAANAYQTVKRHFEGANAKISHELIEGPTGESIVKAAKEMDADLIVVGARGRSTVNRLLLGSISDFVATHAECSVLVVRPSVHNEDNGPLRIAIGFEAWRPARAALEEFSEFVWGPQTEVEVVSVEPTVKGVSRGPAEVAESVRFRQSEADKAIALLRSSAPNATTRIFESENVGEGVVKMLEDHRFNLVVVGETPRGIIGRLLLGSVSRYVLRHAPCSVWIARNRVVA